MTWLRGAELFGEFGRCSPSLLTKESSREEWRVFKKWYLFADNTVRVWVLRLWTKDSCLYFPEADKGMQGIESVGLVPSLHQENERIINVLPLTSAVPNVETTGHT